MKVNFNGVKKQIEILAGVEEIDVQIDLYSDWKEWVLESDNAKYEPAFRTFGGDPTIGSQFAPRYFFLINGWNVVARDVSTSIQTNLYNDGEGTGILLDGAAVSLRNSDAAVVDSSLEESLDYNGVVHIDTTGEGSPGTTYPIGTIGRPVNNATDAFVIAENFGIKSFSVNGTLVLSDDAISKEFVAKGFGDILIFNDVQVDGCRFSLFNATGTIRVTPNNNVFFKECGIQNLNGMNGILEKCVILDGTITLSTLQQERYINMSDCVSNVAGSGYPILEIPDASLGTYSSVINNINVRRYSGGIGLSGSFGSTSSIQSNASIDFSSGTIHLEPSIEGGHIVIRGIGTYNNKILESNISNVDLNTSGFYYDVEDISIKNAYNDSILVDTINGVSGSMYPSGTSIRPVNNLDDAITLGDFYNIKNIDVVGNLTVIGTDISGKRILSKEIGSILQLFNVRANNTQFISFNLGGSIIVDEPYGNAYFKECGIDTLYGFQGIADRCTLLGGTISLSTTQADRYVLFADCVSNVAGLGSYPIIEVPGTFSGTFSFVDNDINIRRYSGGIGLGGEFGTSSRASIDFSSGVINLLDSITGGDISIRGIGVYNNQILESNINNVNIDTSGFYYDVEDTSIKSSYSDFVHVDLVNGVSGSIYPIGTDPNPVSNVEDALIIVNKYSLDGIEFETDATLSNIDASSLRLTSQGYPINLVIDNITASRSDFLQVSVTGTFSNDGTALPSLIDRCLVGNINNFNGVVYNSGLGGEIRMGDNANISLLDCKSVISGLGSPVISKLPGVTSSCSVNIRGYSGGIKIKDFNNVNDIITIEFIAGRANIDSSCTNGTIVLRGVGELNNQMGTSSNVNLITDGFVYEGKQDLQSILQQVGTVSTELFRQGDVVDDIQNSSGSTSSQVFDLLQAVSATVSLIKTDTSSIITSTSDVISSLGRIEGLTHRNFRTFDQTYDSNNLLTSARVRTYINKNDCDLDQNHLYEYSVEASYDTQGRLVDYKMTDI